MSLFFYNIHLEAKGQCLEGARAEKVGSEEESLQRLRGAEGHGRERLGSRWRFEGVNQVSPALFLSILFLISVFFLSCSFSSFFFFVSVNQSRGIWSRAWVRIVQPEEVTLRAVRPRDHPSRGKVWGGRARGTFYSQRSTTSRRFLVRSERVGYLEGQGTQKTDFSFYFYLLKVKFLCRSFRFNFLKYIFFFFLSPLLV